MHNRFFTCTHVATQAAFATLILLVAGCASTAAPPVAKPNILVITVDDMNADSVGAFGSSVAQITPHIDSLAQAGMRFTRAHVQVANCMPSRNVMWSGLYPHSSGVEGFRQVQNPGYAGLSELLQEAGYFTAVRHKVTHSTPYTPYHWDSVLDDASATGRPHKKDPLSYGDSVALGIERAAAQGKPFYLLVNIADPHLPFYGLTRRGKPVNDPYKPTRIYAAQDVTVPGFLPDDPVIRQELASYFSTVRRADDAVGAILAALQRSGAAENTLVLFVSDHGMPFPFAKTQLYHYSTLTPLIVRWPAVVAAGAVDKAHMVSAVDFLPTLVEAAQGNVPLNVQGRSFLPLLYSQPQDDRDFVIKEYNENSGGLRTPMRAVQGKRFLYVFNPWSNGERQMHSATKSGDTYRRLVELTKSQPDIAERVRLFNYREVEEFYDIENDPNCLNNLVQSPAYQQQLALHRAKLLQWMRETNDHALPAFENRDSPSALAAYMAEQNAAIKTGSLMSQQSGSKKSRAARPE